MKKLFEGVIGNNSADMIIGAYRDEGRDGAVESGELYLQRAGMALIASRSGGKLTCKKWGQSSFLQIGGTGQGGAAERYNLFHDVLQDNFRQCGNRGVS
jgi:hypothetical protein